MRSRLHSSPRPREAEVRMNLNTDGLTGSIDIGPRGMEDWRECAVAVQASGFSANFGCSVRDEELRHFHSDLETALSRLGQECEIDFETLEYGFAFKLRLNRRGGYLQIWSGLPGTISFRLLLGGPDTLTRLGKRIGRCLANVIVVSPR
jgi:hypothetical protein